MDEPLTVSVFGAGVFAGFHAAKVADHSRAALAGVYDPDMERAEALAKRMGTTAFQTAEEAIEAAQAAIVAVPAVYHKTVAIPVLAAGRAALIEKPLADTVEAAEAIALLAERSERPVQIGHQERIVAEVIGLHSIPERPTEIEIVRSSGRTARNLDISVVKDLMIHDLDLLLALYGRVLWSNTEMARRVYSDHIDTIRAELGFEGLTAYLTASRDAAPERRWVLRYPSGTVEIDFAAKTLRNGTPFALDENFGDKASVKDSLGAAFDRFVRACLDGDPVLASAKDGLEAVHLADALEQAL